MACPQMLAYTFSNSGEKESGKAALKIILTHYNTFATARNPNPALVKSVVNHRGPSEAMPILLLVRACEKNIGGVSGLLVLGEGCEVRVFRDEHDGPGGTPTLLEACKEYFVKTGAKSACFDDLKEYLEMLAEIETEEFLTFVAERVSGMSDLIEMHLRSMFGQGFEMLTLSFRRAD
ncbi:hypothetical protein B9Z19DRAFT_1067135 [Tuber borchii]|uniref:Uncharacterized protein n=1 Tax=Tuber borchii TaxID=42251 RepID=A0A2T6ZJY1_TUBBO|nr:hypothetical protein B9Z19DRAFT_1067135 [Tuber borchii]